ncbi:MAG: DNA-directed RNA polymerase subunit B'', partial [Nanoarchaeota archaeon]
MNTKHLLIKKYLEQHSLVESNIRSFNDFVSARMQSIVNEVNDQTTKEDVDVTLGKIRIGKPDVIEADGSVSQITPTEARLRSLTYSAPVFIELSARYGEQADSGEVEIGRIPIMVRSATC